MVGKFTGTIVGLVTTKAYEGRPPAGRIDFLVPDRDTQKVMSIKCDLNDIPRLNDSQGKPVILDIDINEYDITDDKTGQRKQGISYKLFKPAK